MQRVVQVLTILALLALTPALAQGSQPSFKPTSSTLVLPVGQELSDGELVEVEGRLANLLLGAAFGAGQEVYHQLTTRGRIEDWGAVALSTALGAAGGALGGVRGSVLESIASSRVGAYFIAGGMAGTIRGHYDNAQKGRR